MKSLAKNLCGTILLLASLQLATAQEPLFQNLRFGPPSPAKADNANREDYLIERQQYALSYNARTRTPNWVSWCLRKEEQKHGILQYLHFGVEARLLRRTGAAVCEV